MKMKMSERKKRKTSKMFILDEEREKKLSSGINKIYFYMTEQQKTKKKH